MKIAGYIYGYNKKRDSSYDFDALSNYLTSEAEKKNVTIDELYADGYSDIPNGLEELISDLGNYTAIVLYSLEGLSDGDLIALGKKQLYCVNSPWITGKHSVNEMSKVIQSREYYDKMRSLNIKMGIVRSTKRSGKTPFGYKYDSQNNIVEVPEEIALIHAILNLKKQNQTVSQIAEQIKLPKSKVYKILNYWSKKNEVKLN